MKPFVYDIPTKIYFGPNQLEGNLGQELARFGKKVLLCYGGGSIKKSGLYDKVVAQIKEAGLELFELSGIEPNPRVDSVRAGAKICKEEGIDVLLAVGGGSVIDCVKFISGATFYEGDAWDLSTGAAKFENALPIVTVLTLSATGSEMNNGGVITNLETKEKLGNGSPLVKPKVSFLDPTNTFTVSPYQTAAGSVDIMSHTMEIYFIEKGMDFLHHTMEGILKTVIDHAPVALKEPDNYEARANLMWAGTWAINGFLSSQQDVNWTIHPIEHELSAFYDITHAHGLAIITPRWMEYILDETTVDRFYNFGVNVWNIDRNLDKMEVAKQAIQATADFFFNTLGLSKDLKDLGIGTEHFDIMAERVANRGGTGFLNGYRKLTAEDIKNILHMCNPA